MPTVDGQFLKKISHCIFWAEHVSFHIYSLRIMEKKFHFIRLVQKNAIFAIVAFYSLFQPKYL